MSEFDRRIGERLERRDLRGLFLEELGWDQPGIASLPVEVDEDGYEARPIAQKRGLHVLEVATEGDVPSADVQHRIDAEIAQRVPERLLVFSGPSRQIWRWPRPRKSGGVRLIPQEVVAGNASAAIVQRLASVRFQLAEEDTLTLPLVKDRVRAQFSAEKVTNRFYEQFQERHSSLQDELEGIEGQVERRWYASVLMNRLMFIYFFQKKGFLNEDREYLRSCLEAIRGLRGEDEFYAFYREVLLPMFHHGFGSAEHDYPDAEVAKIIGDVPYVNGGIFERHEIEAAYEIQVPDREFERIFDFFDEFRWHLDEREHGDPDAIDPDVIGYIFERYINVTAAGQKEGGAYYTKEDVTGYMAASTLLPKILERLIERCDTAPFDLLRNRPLRYLNESQLRGRGPDGWQPLPDAVAEAVDDVGRWSEMNAAERDEELQLPGESWIETVDRRGHVEGLIDEIEAGEVATVDALIARNLDVRTLVADLIHGLDSPADVAGAWEEISAVAVIDPTCGSGAFLFAALDLFDECYAALLERARSHLASGGEEAAGFLGPLVAEADRHPNDDYYRRKHVALNNLYGLDIMREAIETAKLRLFLALVSKLERRSEVEPLPDLDYNIRAGNLLVGFRDIEDARGRVGTSTFEAMAAVDEFLPKAERLAELRSRFVAAQDDGAHEGVSELKRELGEMLAEVRGEADSAYAAAAAVETEGDGYEAWLSSHQPFHWLLEFPAVLERGGFDVVIGNPPYIRRRSVSYAIAGYETADLEDIYAPCVERSLSLLAKDGRFAMILPISFQFSESQREAREVALRQGSLWVSTYSRNPSALFTAGLGVRNAIAIASPHGSDLSTTATRRWTAGARPSLFPTTRYAALNGHSRSDAWFVRTGDDEIAELLQALRERGETLGAAVARKGKYMLGFKVTALYYLPVYTEVPPVYDDRLELVPPPKDRAIPFATEEDRLLAYALLAGELAIVWWAATGDDFDVTGATLTEFPIGLAMLAERRDEILERARELEREAHKPEHLLFTPYAKRMTGVWDLRRLRHLTRPLDRLILETIGLERFQPAVLRAIARFDKSTGERPGTERGTEWLEARRASLA